MAYLTRLSLAGIWKSSGQWVSGQGTAITVVCNSALLCWMNSQKCMGTTTCPNESKLKRNDNLSWHLKLDAIESYAVVASSFHVIQTALNDTVHLKIILKSMIHAKMMVVFFSYSFSRYNFCFIRKTNHWTLSIRQDRAFCPSLCLFPQEV